MKRKNFKQILDRKWIPKHLKNLSDEFLSWFVVRVNATSAFTPFILKGLEASGRNTLINIDLGSGAGIESCRHFLDASVVIENIPFDKCDFSQKGLYTIINCLHKMDSDQLKELLSSAAASGNPLVAMEGNNNNWYQAIGMTIFVPLTVLLTGPFVKPFRLTRLLFTYLIPILTLLIPIDGIIALFKLYDPKDLKEITDSIDNNNYKWAFGKKDNGRGGKIIFLTGVTTA